MQTLYTGGGKKKLKSANEKLQVIEIGIYKYLISLIINENCLQTQNARGWQEEDEVKR